MSKNTIKHGRIWFYPWKTIGKNGIDKEKDYQKSIGIEWSLRFNPLIFCFSFDGDENRYVFNFWFIYVFYISINGFRNWYYPKEWNSCVNNGKGGYLNSAERKIGISQYNWSLYLYFWHDGEYSWYKDKCDKIWYKFIMLDELIIGSRMYHTIEDDENKILYLDLPEKTYKLDISYRFWHRKSKRLLFRFLNHKGKSYHIRNEDIPYQARIPDEYDIQEGYHGEEMIRDQWFSLKENQTDEDLLREYKKYILSKRMEKGSKDWVPYEYRKNKVRENKLKRILI